MRKASRKLMFSLMTFLLAGSALAGCSENNAENEPASSPDMSSESAVVYPLKTDTKLTYWGALPNNLTGVKSAHAEVPFYQEWQKRTGITVDFTTPPANKVDESFNVMLASGELPDLLEYNFFNFPGGPEKAIKDGYILELNDLIDKYAPNYKKYLQEHPEIEKMVKTDNGSYYSFPFIRVDETQLTLGSGDPEGLAG